MQTEQFQTKTGIPADVVCEGPERKIDGAREAQHHGGGRRQLSQPLGETRALRPVAVFIPPAVLDEEDAVFHLPMVARGAEQIGG